MLEPIPPAGFDAAQALQEGWGLYTAFTESAVVTDLTRAPGSTAFADDVAAREFIAERVCARSPYHVDAVRLLRRTDIEGYKVFREEHPECAEITDTDPLF